MPCKNYHTLIFIICSSILHSVSSGELSVVEKQAENEKQSDSRIYFFKKIRGAACAYTASWLADINLFRRVTWYLDSTKMEAASFQIFDKSHLKFQVTDPDSYYVHHMSKYEHSIHRAKGFAEAQNRTLILSNAAVLGECDNLVINPTREYLALIPFYGGLPPDIGKNLQVNSRGQGNSLVSASTKSLQCMATLCSTLKYYGHTVVGVVRDDDRDLINRALDNMHPSIRERTAVVQLSMPKPANLPFHLLTWAQNYIKDHNCKLMSGEKSGGKEVKVGESLVEKVVEKVEKVKGVNHVKHVKGGKGGKVKEGGKAKEGGKEGGKVKLTLAERVAQEAQDVLSGKTEEVVWRILRAENNDIDDKDENENENENENESLRRRTTTTPSSNSSSSSSSSSGGVVSGGSGSSTVSSTVSIGGGGGSNDAPLSDKMKSSIASLVANILATAVTAATTTATAVTAATTAVSTPATTATTPSATATANNHDNNDNVTFSNANSNTNTSTPLPFIKIYNTILLREEERNEVYDSTHITMRICEDGGLTKAIGTKYNMTYFRPSQLHIDNNKIIEQNTIKATIKAAKRRLQNKEIDVNREESKKKIQLEENNVAGKTGKSMKGEAGEKNVKNMKLKRKIIAETTAATRTQTSVTSATSTYKRVVPIKFVYYTECDQIIRYDSMVTFKAFSASLNESCFFAGRRREKIEASDAADYMGGLNEWRECGEHGYSMNWPAENIIRKNAD